LSQPTKNSQANLKKKKTTAIKTKMVFYCLHEARKSRNSRQKNYLDGGQVVKD